MAEHRAMGNAHDAAHAHDHPHDHIAGPEAAAHVGWKKYVAVGVILAVVTGMEVAAVELDLLPPALIVPILLVLTAAKFFLVVLYYMHLKMDHPIFGRVFWAPMFLSVLVVIGLILLFHVLPTYGKFSN
jgi:cytochrome c oxidase subunit IV